MTARKTLSGLLSPIIFLSLFAGNAQANLEKHCQMYAAKAVEQHQRNLSLGCDYSGPRWSNDREGQKQWCLTVKPAITNKENQAREELLRDCSQPTISSRSLAAANDSPNGLPRQCLSSGYTPVDSIQGKRTANDKTATHYSPIKAEDGIIRDDFSDDSEPDYVFIENNRSGKNYRLATCVSQGGSYNKTVLPIAVQDNAQGKTVRSYEISESYGKLSISETITQTDGQNSKSTISIYGYNPKKQSFLLEVRNRLDFGSGGISGVRSQQYDLLNKRWKETLSCQSVPAEFRDLCQPEQRNGPLVLPAKLPDLKSHSAKTWEKKRPE